jgi:hypothetical protein
MASILLVFGAPDHGKSELAKKLEAQFGFYRIEVDEVYADFIEALYPPPRSLNLRHFILPHYDGGYPALGCGTGFSQDVGRRNHWHHHLLQQIEEAAARHPKVVVEGYLLRTAAPSYTTS